MVFLDKAKISVRAGSGGDGCMSFRREKFVPRGGPDGGDGGRGGSIFLEASCHESTLYPMTFKPHLIADRGTHGKGSNMYGRSGDDLTVFVPIGTLVYDNSGSLNAPVLLGELLEHGQRLCVAKGGRGGRGNAAFKSNFNRAPRNRERGFPGEERTLNLELKLLADVGLIGLPNAGKSSLLARISAARPKVADYPFTTISPVLGVCDWKLTRFVAADVPGLIEGAHRGRGLGFEFLRHIERTRILIHLIEPKPSGVLTDLRAVEQELKRWDPALLKKPRIIGVTKADIGDPAGKTEREIRKRRSKIPVISISSQTGFGIAKLLDKIIKAL